MSTRQRKIPQLVMIFLSKKYISANTNKRIRMAAMVIPIRKITSASNGVNYLIFYCKNLGIMFILTVAVFLENNVGIQWGARHLAYADVV